MLDSSLIPNTHPNTHRNGIENQRAAREDDVVNITMKKDIETRKALKIWVRKSQYLRIYCLYILLIINVKLFKNIPVC